jgi:hypothetical protein
MATVQDKIQSTIRDFIASVTNLAKEAAEESLRAALGASPVGARALSRGKGTAPASASSRSARVSGSGPATCPCRSRS